MASKPPHHSHCQPMKSARLFVLRSYPVGASTATLLMCSCRPLICLIVELVYNHLSLTNQPDTVAAVIGFFVSSSCCVFSSRFISVNPYMRSKALLPSP